MFQYILVHTESTTRIYAYVTDSDFLHIPVVSAAAVQPPWPTRSLRPRDEAVGGADGPGGALRLRACPGTNMSRLHIYAAVSAFFRDASNSLFLVYQQTSNITRPKHSYTRLS